MNGFTAIPNPVLRNRDLTITAKVVYGVILSYAWSDQPCTQDWREICADCQIGRTAFFDAIKALKAAGLLAVEKRRINEGHANVYIPLARGAVASGVVRNPDEVADDLPDDPKPTSSSRVRETKKTKEEGDDVSLFGDQQKAPSAKRKGRDVPGPIVDKAVRLFEFACSELGSRRRPLTGAGEPSPDLKTIIARLVDYPDIDEDELREKVRTYIAKPPSWVDAEKPNLGQIFGPRAFGHVLDTTPTKLDADGRGKPSMADIIAGRAERNAEDTDWEFVS